MDEEIDKQTAADVSKQLLEAFYSVENAMRIIQEKCSEDEFNAFRSEAGKVAGGLYLLLEPLWKAYPELAPEGIDMTPRKREKGQR